MTLFYKIVFAYLTSGILYTVVATVFTAWQNKKIQFGVCKSGKDDITFMESTLPKCIQNCLHRKECVSVNFQRRRLMCRLNRENSTLYDCKSPGNTYSAKTTWEIQTPVGCSTCQRNQVCTYDDSSVQPRCVFTECRKPDETPEGIILGNQYYVGSQVLYTCQQGYTLHGFAYRTCLGNGDWSGIEPICCPTGWLQYERSCYKFQPGLLLKFDEALTHCQQLHQWSNLLFIESEGEDTYIKDTLELLEGIQTNPKWIFYWIGITRNGNQWQDVETNSTVAWFNWLPNEPNHYKGGTENCGSLLFSPSWLLWGWNDISCDSTHETICELNRN